MRHTAFLLALPLLAAACTSPATPDPSASPAWERLLVPGSFDGWHTAPGGQWTWEGDVLVGRSDAAEARHGLLITDDQFDDFEARVEFRTGTGCSGFYFRVEEVGDGTAVAGFQAEIDPSPETGGLYETAGRAWVVKPDPELVNRIFTPGAWTRMSVRAVGGDVEVRVNGHVTASLTDDPGRRRGHLALQMHGGQDMHIEFRRLDVRRIAPEATP